MNIRRKIFLSYIVLVILATVYALLFMFFGVVQSRIDEKIADLYQSKGIWNDLLISLNELQINWSDGKTYKNFKEKYDNLEAILSAGAGKDIRQPLFFDYNLGERRKALYETWSIAGESIRNLIGVIESADFRKVVRSVEKQPGLERLNHLWMELFSSDDSGDKKDAYILRQVMDNIEFFPIYSETLNHLFNVIIDETDQVTTGITSVHLSISLLFLVLFLVLYMIFAIRFSGAISNPIINLSLELSAFMGKTLKIESYSHTDELHLLTLSVSNLIEHYTYLSELAGQLAAGELSSPIMELQNQGVVGNALKDINLYLKELAETSKWIKEGNYGAEVRVKSAGDILAMNFNIMSKVILEKITTLRNMFEAVEESIAVVDYNGNIIEANSKFYHLTGADSSAGGLPGTENIRIYFNFDKIVTDLMGFGKRETLYTNLGDLQGNLIPVKIVPRTLPDVPGQKSKLILFITNESIRVRAEREKEKLKAHAVEAELRALRAQINPHFLFNTLNAIAHLVESRSGGAVKMIEKLSDLFRYSLASTRRSTVQLAEEIEIIKQFLDIEKMRFGDNLIVKYCIDEELTHNNIPPMLIQPLVENALKYGLDGNGKIYVTISICRGEKSLNISVSDNGSQAVNQQMLLGQNGTGIKNVNQRLKSLYNNQLRFIQNSPQGLTVVIEIPVEGESSDTYGYY